MPASPDTYEFAFDIETNGFRPTTIHSLVITHVHTGDTFSCADQPGYLSIADGISLLESTEAALIGHNILTYDAPWLRKLRGARIARDVLFDTLTACRILWPDLRDTDDRITEMPATLVGKHSLAAWGYRLGVLKGAFGKQTDWQFWSPEMQKYCEQDVTVTCALYHHIVAALG